MKWSCQMEQGRCSSLDPTLTWGPAAAVMVKTGLQDVLSNVPIVDDASCARVGQIRLKHVDQHVAVRMMPVLRHRREADAWRAEGQRGFAAAGA